MDTHTENGGGRLELLGTAATIAFLFALAFGWLEVAVAWAVRGLGQ